MHKFSPSGAERLERPERYRLIPPAETLRRFLLGPGMHFLDAGAGTGFFSRAASSIVGPSGHVYAAEMSDDMVETFRHYGVPENVSLVRSAEYAIPFPAGIADLALLAFVLHENVEKRELLNEVLRIVKEGGKLAIVEWKKQREENGPPVEERLGEDEVDQLLHEYQVVDRGDLNGSHYYRVIMRGPAPPASRTPSPA